MWEQHSNLPRAVQAEWWQSLGRPRVLSSAPAAGCPRVNETLLLLQTISDIFADNATLSSSLEASPAAPAWPPPRPAQPPHRRPPSLPWPHHPAQHLAPAPRPSTSPQWLFGSAWAQLQSRASSRLPSLPSDPLLLWKLHPT